MKRDIKLVRELLLVAEADGTCDGLNSKYGQEVVAGHVAILIDAKLIEGQVVCDEAGKPCYAVIVRLTWAGHEFLDNARNETVWNKVITSIKDTATTVSFEILSELLKVGVSSAVSNL